MAPACPDNGVAVNSDPPAELSMSCGARHATTSPPDSSTPRHAKARSKRGKRAALRIPSPVSNVPSSPTSPTSPDPGPSHKTRDHRGASSAPLHRLTEGHPL